MHDTKHSFPLCFSWNSKLHFVMLQAFLAGLGPSANNFPHRVPSLSVPVRQGSSDEDSLGATGPFGGGLPVGMLDAAKRKHLPAWIREGLEKMEREKQKKEEREKFLAEREALRKIRIEREAAEGGRPDRSRFDDDSDEEEEDPNEKQESDREAVDEDSEDDGEPARPSFSLQPSAPVERLQDLVRIN